MSDLKFTVDHDWLRLEADGTVTIGITEFAADQLGDLVFVELPEIGQTFAQGEDAAVIESVKAAADIKLPISGEISGANNQLLDEPGLANDDPMGEGWFLKVIPSDRSQLDTLLDPDAYAAHVAAEK
jgi:glycine cleavage system H protein